MPSLRELQQGFADAVLAGDDTAPPFAVAGARDGAERIAIYRRAIFSNYRNALSATYPVVKRLVGAPFFHAAVDAYVHAHPSVSGDLNVYGDTFGDFLAAYPYAASLPYLPDVARLEWAIDEANRATDRPANPDAVVAALAGVPAEALPAVRMHLHPTVRLVASAFPIQRIWEVNQPDHDGADTVALDAGGDALLVRRRAEGITLTRLAAADHAWLAALAAGRTLAEAIDAAQGADAGFVLGTSLSTHIATGTIAAIARD